MLFRIDHVYSFNNTVELPLEYYAVECTLSEYKEEIINTRFAKDNFPIYVGF